ncbi:MAG: hypothetical protein H6Q64_1079 [Firmicutes bacterium]|nr:hypothetical protein [Bacillota bacterium]
MKRLLGAIKGIIQGLVKAISRFPLTVLCLVAATSLVCYMISLDKSPDILIQKLLFTCLMGAFLGVAAQFSCERFERLARFRLLVYFGAVVLVGAYYLSLGSSPSIEFDVQIRTFVAVFAMFCFYLWVPSYRDGFNFESIALIHVKAAFTSVLYSAVLSAGCASIIATVDILLFNINDDAYGYTMSIIWILFAILYYLSLLPKFNSEDESDREYARMESEYPRLLEILISYIAVPLVTIYTLVLVAYFIKILVTMHWPSGQLGPMVLAYSTAGLIIYILAGRLENRPTSLYRLIFPKVLIPIVIMQLVSVAIRLNAFGVTESRYYVALFGIFSIVCAVILSIRPIARNSIIVLLAAGFALISIIPPIDAFTVSRVSQTTRLENLLQAEGVLADGKISPKADVSMDLRIETTNILQYLQNRKYTGKIAWLPANFDLYKDMKNTFGFETAYPEYPGQADYFYAATKMDEVIGIKGYDIMYNGHSYRGQGKNEVTPVNFTIDNEKYQLSITRMSTQETRVAVKDAAGKELVGTGLYDFVQSLRGVTEQSKGSLSSEEMTLVTEKNGYKLYILFQDVNVTYGNSTDAGADYNFLVFFSAPE